MLGERGQMKTTQRTSIRRRLAVRRAAHRPPLRWRQVAHRPIVAPRAATLVASIALGVGVALARAERERRVELARRKRERRFGLNADEPLGEGLRRIALVQLDIAIDALAGATGGSAEEQVHEARKALKRLRALLRLLEDELGARSYERDSALVAEAGRGVAKARDAAVLLRTLDSLIERQPNKLGGRAGVRRLRARLADERDREARRALADSERGRAIEDLLALRARAAAWAPAPNQIEALEPALERIYSQGRKRMRRAARASGARSRGRKLHEWRKRVKDLRYAAEMLDRDGAAKRAGARRKRGARKRARAQAAFPAKVARRADELGELLGAEHDLAVLAERVRGGSQRPSPSGELGRRSRRALLRAIARRRRRMRARALRDGARLYSSAPKPFVRQMRAASSVSRR
jgi:CHAD domain-containing protein